MRLPTLSSRSLVSFGCVAALLAGALVTSLAWAGESKTNKSVSAATQSVTILGGGDLLVHPPLWKQAAEQAKSGQKYNFDPVFSGIRSVVTGADLALCHMEAPMGPGAPQDFPRFRAPVQLAGAVARAGFDGCSTASNHSMDQDVKGVTSTLEALDSAGLGHTGTARNPGEWGRHSIYDVSGAQVGHLSYAYGMNRNTPPRKGPWMANVIDIPAILASARQLRLAGADIIVLSMHWGSEYNHAPTTKQVTGARELMASPDIDVIIGHHAHVVQPAEKINGKWVFYGVGNLVARHDFPKPENREGILPRLTFAPTKRGTWEVVKAEAVPTWLSLEPVISVVNLPDTINRLSSSDNRNAKYRAAHKRIVSYLDQRGAVAQGLRVVAPTR